MAAAIMATRRNAVEGSQFSQLNAAALSAERELALLQGTKSSILLEDEPTRQKEAIRLCDQARRNNATFLALPLDLHEIPESLFKLKKLEWLDLSNNKLNYLPKRLFALSNLQTLVLDNNKIVELSDDVAKLKQLTTLSLRGNYLERLHPAVCRLPKLRKLDLGHNHLTVLPSEIRGLAKTLAELKVDDNRLESLPEEVCELICLTKLEARLNIIATLPQGLHKLKDLLFLGLAYNQIVEIPPTMGTMDGLLSLDMTANHVDTPPPIVCNEGASAIRHYLNDLEAGSERLHYLTMVLVGQAGAPQTAFAKSLSGAESVDYPKFKWTPDVHLHGSQTKLEVDVWDCPADKIFHETHKMMLYKQYCLFMVVVDMQAYSEETHEELVQQWVRCITSRVRNAKIVFGGVNTASVSPVDLQTKSAYMRAALKLEETKSVASLTREVSRLSQNEGSSESSSVRGWQRIRELSTSEAKMGWHEDALLRAHLVLSARPTFLAGGFPLMTSGAPAAAAVAAGSGGSAIKTSPRTIHVRSAAGLVNTDTFGKSDSFATVFIDGVEVGQTDVKDNCLDPEWNYSLTLDLPTDRNSRLRLLVQDKDVDADDYLGEIEVVIGGNTAPMYLETTTFDLNGNAANPNFCVTGTITIAIDDGTGNMAPVGDIGAIQNFVLGLLPMYPHVGCRVPIKFMELFKTVAAMHAAQPALLALDFDGLRGAMKAAGSTDIDDDQLRRGIKFLERLGLLYHIPDIAALAMHVCVNPLRLARLCAVGVLTASEQKPPLLGVLLEQLAPGANTAAVTVRGSEICGVLQAEQVHELWQSLGVESAMVMSMLKKLTAHWGLLTPVQNKDQQIVVIPQLPAAQLAVGETFILQTPPLLPQ